MAEGGLGVARDVAGGGIGVAREVAGSALSQFLAMRANGADRRRARRRALRHAASGPPCTGGAAPTVRGATAAPRRRLDSVVGRDRRQRRRPTHADVPSVDALPIPDYDELSASQVVERLEGLDRDVARRDPRVRDRAPRPQHDPRQDRAARLTWRRAGRRRPTTSTRIVELAVLMPRRARGDEGRRALARTRGAGPSRSTTSTAPCSTATTRCSSSAPSTTSSSGSAPW